jgi:segregation and condensation protein B
MRTATGMTGASPVTTIYAQRPFQRGIVVAPLAVPCLRVPCKNALHRGNFHDAKAWALWYNRLSMQEHLTRQSMNGNLQIEEVRLPIQHVASAIESLLFVSGRPLEHAELRKLLNIDDARLASSLQVLADNLESQGRGIRLQRLGEHVQLVTAPENARYVAALLGLPMTAKLTTAAMETLAVVSYRQPTTRAQIEAIRGVNSDRALASLIQHGLVAEIGRAQTVGRPALFATTSEFLQQFGLTGLEQLPGVEMREQETE